MAMCHTPWCVNMWVSTLQGRFAKTSRRQDVAKVRAPSAGSTADTTPPPSWSTTSNVMRRTNTAAFTHTRRVNMPPSRHIAFTFSHMAQ